MRRAFTLVEMLVVMVVIVLILAIALPAFSNIMASQEEVTAESQLQAALGTARDAAIRNGPGEDAAAVFTFEPRGRLTVLTAVKVGVVRDPGARPRAGFPDRYEVFAPLSAATPVQLPINWMVRGFAPANTIGPDWYGPRPSGARSYLQTGAGANNAAWVSPETGFFDHSIPDDGAQRNTFMVRFAGGTGALAGMSMPPTLVVLPRPWSAGRSGQASDQWRRPDRAEDLAVWAKRVLTQPTDGVWTPQARWNTIGRPSGDMALAMPVQMLALYDESNLARALGVRPDRLSGSILYVDPQAYDGDPPSIPRRQLRPQWLPEIVAGPYGGDPGMAISRWIEGYANLTTVADDTRAETGGARLYTVSRYVGTLQPLLMPRPEEVSP